MDITFSFFSVPLTLGIILTYVPVLAAIVTLPWTDRKVSLALAGLATLIALLSGLIAPVALISIFLLLLLCYSSERTSRYVGLSYIALFLLCLAIFLHIAPGFNNPQLLNKHQFDTASLPFNLYLNFDKAILGLILLSFFAGKGKAYQQLTLPKLLLLVAALSVTAFIIAVVGGLVAFSPKLSEHFVIWALLNLFITCVAEEVVFRGFIQRKLQQWLVAKQRPAILAVVATALFFGVVHLSGGPLYVALASLMGFGYGYVYYVSGKLRWAIAFHFGFNACHFVLFSYPMLA